MLSRKLKVGVLQLNPRIGNIPSNIERANRILKNHGFLSETSQKKPIDLLILPELALTGYDFKSKENIKPYLEPTCSGISTNWAKDISKSLNCHTLIGYPELCSKTNKIYNSATMVSPSGNILFNYRKTFLYSADEEWGCEESPDGFESFGPFNSSDPTPLDGLKIQVGICMDLNPYKFEAPFDKFEFANSCVDNDPSLILCPMAWLNSESPSLQSGDELKRLKKLQMEYEMDPSEADYSTVNYWFNRMNPFITKPPTKRIAFITTNRSGWENDVLYAGSSMISVFDPKLSNRNYIQLFGTLGQLEEDLLYQEIEIDV